MTKEKSTVPRLRFPGFTDAWKQRKLGEVAEMYSGGTPSVGRKDYYTGGIPFIRSAEINSDTTELYLTELGLNNSSAKMVSKGSLLYALYGATSGEVGLSRLDGAINQAILAILPNDDLTTEFLMYWLRREKSTIVEKYLQGGQGNLSAGIVKQLEPTIPTLPEQEAIGNFFSDLDQLITLHQRKLDDVKELEKALLQKMFPKGNGNDFPELRFPEFTDAWKQRKLGEVATFAKGNGYSKKDLVIEGSPIILYGRLYTKYETVISEVDTFVSVEDNNNSVVYSEGGEVLVPASGESSLDIARASVVAKKGIILGGDINIIRLHSEIFPVFLALTISNGKQQKGLSKRAQGKSVVHLHNSDLKKVDLDFPTLPEQEVIGSFFSDLDQLITLHQRQLDHLKLLKKALLQQMFI
ncbi:TPA: restriction endonuclease subunit S [Streptococcus suis]